jgi:hypothetical protein
MGMLGCPHRLEAARLERPRELHRRDRVIGVKHRDAKVHLLLHHMFAGMGIELTREAAGLATSRLDPEVI